MLVSAEGCEELMLREQRSTPQTRVAHVDLDDTLIPGLLMEPLVYDQIKEGDLISLSAVPAILGEIQKYKTGKKGHPSNVMGLNMFWAWTCEDVPYIDLLDHARRFVKRNRHRFASYTPAVFDTFNQRGYHIWVDTGEPQYVAQAVVEEFGGTGFCATKWKTRWKNGELVVSGVELPMTSKQKGEWAEKLFTDEPNRQAYTREGSIAVIDSRNDIGLADAVQYSIVCGDPQPELIQHLEQTGKTFAIASPEYVVRFVDRLTERRNKLRSLFG